MLFIGSKKTGKWRNGHKFLISSMSHENKFNPYENDTITRSTFQGISKMDSGQETINNTRRLIP